ncbi:DUF3048 domain-containing protein [Patescibacteria group bacterium]
MQKIGSFFSSKAFMVVVSFLGLYLISAGGTWALFTYVNEAPASTISLGELQDKRSAIADLPKTEECPINGKLYSEPERQIWEERRPATVIVQNHPEARPLSGISQADVVYEAVAEGGVTRFLGVFYCGVSVENLKVAVIRSARVYFIDWAAEYGKNPIFLHWGGANSICKTCPGGVKPKSQIAPEVNAYALLSKLGWMNGKSGNDMNGGTNVGYPVVQREPNRISDEDAPFEHQPVAFTDAIFEEAANRGFAYEDSEGDEWTTGYQPWRFADDNPSGSPKAAKISYEFWRNKSDFDVTWEYDSSDNSYKRSTGGEPFTDWEFDNEQIAAKNVVVQFIKERGPVDTEKHMYYETIDEGDALIFQNGEVVEATWEKESTLDRTKFYDENGKEIEFVRGAIWIAAVPAGNDVDY